MNSKAVKRLRLLENQLFSSVKIRNTSSQQSMKDESGNYQTVDLLYREGRSKLDWFKEKGWGFKDTEFVIDDKTGKVGLTGDRYVFSGKIMPDFRTWAETKIGLDIDKEAIAQK